MTEKPYAQNIDTKKTTGLQLVCVASYDPVLKWDHPFCNKETDNRLISLYTCIRESQI